MSSISFTESQQLVIKSINVPSAVKLGDVDSVILDCDYALENTSSLGLVVKWFFNDDQVIYQWIHGRDPVANELIAKHVNLTYKASDDPFTEYRAIKLDTPGIDLTGDYTCVISTFEDERVANASMVIYCEFVCPPACFFLVLRAFFDCRPPPSPLYLICIDENQIFFVTIPSLS